MTLVRIERVRYLGIIIKKQLKMETTKTENWMKNIQKENQKVIDSLTDYGLQKLVYMDSHLLPNIREKKIEVDTPYEIGVNLIEFVCNEKYKEIPIENLYGFTILNHTKEVIYQYHNKERIIQLIEMIRNDRQLPTVNNDWRGKKRNITDIKFWNGNVEEYSSYWRDRLIKQMNRKYDW